MSKFIEELLEEKSKRNLSGRIKELAMKCKNGIIYFSCLFLAVVIAAPFINSYITAQENSKYAKIIAIREQEIKTTLAAEECMNDAMGGDFYVTKNNPDLKVIKSKFCNTTDNKYICGVIINKSDKKIKGLEVKIDLYNEYDFLLGTTLASINELESNAKWYFKAFAYPYGVENYKIKLVSGL